MNNINFDKFPDHGERAELSHNEIRNLATELDNYRNNSIWFNPLNLEFCKADNPKSNLPDYGQCVAKLENLVESREQIQLAKSLGYELSRDDIDKNTVAPYEKPFQNDAVTFMDGIAKVKKGEIRASALITTQGYSTIANTQINFGSLLDLTNRDFVLDQLVTPYPTDWIKTYYPQIYSFRAAPDIGENDVSSPQSVDYALVPFLLKKAQAHVQASRWASMAPRYFDPVADSKGLIESDFPRIINTDIANQLPVFTNNAAAGQWDTIGGSAFHHTFKPQRDILTNETTIDTAGGTANVLIMNPLTYQIMVENTWMRGQGVLSGIPQQQGVRPKIFTHPLLQGYEIGRERATLIANQTVFEFDKRAVLKFNGPRRAASYDKTAENVEAQIVDVWYGSAVRVAGLGIEITGATT